MTTTAERKVLVRKKIFTGSSDVKDNHVTQEDEFKWLLAQEYRPRVEAISAKLQECRNKFLEAISARGSHQVIYTVWSFNIYYFLERIRPILLQ